MLNIKEHVNLKPYNTFGIEAYCDYFVEVDSISSFSELTKQVVYQNNQKLIIGGGSNLLFTKDFNGIVIKNNFKGINIISENSEEVLVNVAAGEVWHDFVMWSIDHNFSGLENLSLIPGCVGASPMQNIGAYGVEIKETFEELEACSVEDASIKIFKKEACGFGYRESVFKNKYRNLFLISSVTFRLTKNGVLNTTYGAINSELEAMGIDSPTIRDVSRAVINIRQSKLPDPRVSGNAGSFFKNPEIPFTQYLKLKHQFKDLVAYPLNNGNYKLAAGWLIEQCGLKGYEHKGAAVHLKQALVLINKNNSTGLDVYNLSSHVMKKVFDKFGVILEREVNII